MSVDLIRYDLLVQEALRSVVKKVLGDTARDGLRGEHHFNISFKTNAPGVGLPASIKLRYPDEMAIILQHEFWDLAVVGEAFEVSLNFSRRPERLTIPFDAITGFSDPSVPFIFKLEPRLAESARPAAEPEPEVKNELKIESRLKPKAIPPALPPRKADTLATAKAPEKVAEGDAAKVVSIDSFRKK